MTLLNTSTPPRAAWHVLTRDGAWLPVDPTSGPDLGLGAGPGLASLVEQEFGSRRVAPEHPRVRQLQAVFGFEFEPLAEPGHMRYQAPAADMMRRAVGYAESRARAVAADLGMPYDRIDGVTVLDGTSAALAEYLSLTGSDEELYGGDPYLLAPPRAGLLLRQTACLQKYAMAREWDPARTPLPRCVFEISDSYRGEPDDELRLGFRLRRFRLPEAHLYGRSIAESVRHAERLHARYLDDLAQVADEVVLLVTVTAGFAERHRGFLTGLAAGSSSPALVKVCPPGTLCQDGVEIDVEYKVVDATGFARELSSFQIDELITRAFGIGRPDAPVTTIHTPPVGSIERLVFAALDRVARIEAGGGRARLPLWLSPFGIRLAWAPGDAPAAATVAALGRQLAGHGLPIDVDDRLVPLARKIADADAELVPFLVLLDGRGQLDRVRVRTYETERIAEIAPAALLDGLPAHDVDPNVDPSVPESPRLLSARPVLTGGKGVRA
ncbi:MAG: hypothetical protein ABW215_07075 [Kibdelosporangium sp.]